MIVGLITIAVFVYKPLTQHIGSTTCTRTSNANSTHKRKATIITWRERETPTRTPSLNQDKIIKHGDEMQV